MQKSRRQRYVVCGDVEGTHKIDISLQQAKTAAKMYALASPRCHRQELNSIFTHFVLNFTLFVLVRW